MESKSRKSRGSYVRRYSSRNMDDAIKVVKTGSSMYKASKQFNIPYQTLRDKINNRYPGSKAGIRTILKQPKEEHVNDNVDHNLNQNMNVNADIAHQFIVIGNALNSLEELNIDKHEMLDFSIKVCRQQLDIMEKLNITPQKEAIEDTLKIPSQDQEEDFKSDHYSNVTQIKLEPVSF